jgi:hypothetical protein
VVSISEWSEFQSARAARRATLLETSAIAEVVVSIRARRAARDSSDINDSHSAPIMNVRANVPERSRNYKALSCFKCQKNVSRTTYIARALSPERLFA